MQWGHSGDDLCLHVWGLSWDRLGGGKWLNGWGLESSEGSFTCHLGQTLGREDSKTEVPPHAISNFGFLITWQSQSSWSFYMAAQGHASKHPNKEEAMSPFMTQPQNSHSVGLRVTALFFSRDDTRGIFSVGGNVEVFCNHVSKLPQLLTKIYLLIFGILALQKWQREIQTKKLWIIRPKIGWCMVEKDIYVCFWHKKNDFGRMNYRAELQNRWGSVSTDT